MSDYNGDNYSTNMEESFYYGSDNMEEEVSMNQYDDDFSMEGAETNQPEKDSLETIRNTTVGLIAGTGYSYEEIKYNEAIQRSIRPGQKPKNLSLFQFLFPGEGGEPGPLDKYCPKDIANSLLPLERKVKKEKKEREQAKAAGGMNNQAPTPRRKNPSSYLKRNPRVSPKRPDFGSDSKKRREFTSANSGIARGSKHIANRRAYSKSPLPQDPQQNQLSTNDDSLPPPMNLFNTKSDNQLDASQTAVQRTASATNKYEGPAYRVLRDPSDQPSSSKDTPPCILNRLLLAGAQSLLLDADAVEKISNDFKDVDITDAVLSMDILSSDYLISKLRENSNTPEVWESLNPQVVASYFSQVLR